MSIRFQADADLNQAIVAGVLRRDSNIDFQTANVSDLSGLSDLEVLLTAAHDGRVLVSHDQRTMPKYFAEFISNQTSSGLIIVLQSTLISKAIDNLLRIWEISEPEDWINRIAYLPLQELQQPHANKSLERRFEDSLLCLDVIFRRQALIDSGLVRHTKKTSSQATVRRLIQVQGEPISNTIVGERRQMAVHFLDSSALVKRYINEIGSAWISGLFDPVLSHEIKE